MSHFAIAVITDDPNKLSDLMEPFDENLSVPRYIKKTVAELQKEFDEFKIRIHEDLKLDPDIDESNKTNFKYATGIIEGTNDFEHGTWTVKDFSEWYHGYEDEDFDDEGNAYSSYNPNSKWDWYDIGGRWSNLLLLKNGQHTNAAKIKDIFFHGYSKIPVDDTNNPILGIIENDTKEIDNDWDTIMTTRSCEDSKVYLDKYGTKENYIDQQMKFSTYAVITEDGKWNAPGDMGWFGMNSDIAKEKNKFVNGYYESFIKNTNPEYYLIIVDCHI